MCRGCMLSALVGMFPKAAPSGPRLASRSDSPCRMLGTKQPRNQNWLTTELVRMGFRWIYFSLRECAEFPSLVRLVSCSKHTKERT